MTKRHIRHFMLTLPVVAIGMAALASAAVVPSQPAVVSGSAGAGGQTEIAVAHGTGVAAWSARTVRCSPATAFSVIHGDAFGASVAAPPSLHFDPQAGGVTSVPKGGVLVAGTAVGRTCTPLPMFAFLTASGKVGKPHRLGARASHSLAVGSNGAGFAGLAYADTSGLTLASGPGVAGHFPARTVRLSSQHGVTRVAIAVAADDAVLVAWQQGDAVWARIVGPSGHAGKLQRLGQAFAAPGLTAAIRTGGKALVAWETEAISEGNVTSATTAALASATGGRFHERTVLAHFDDRPFGAADEFVLGAGVRTVFTTSGGGFVAWTARAGAEHVILAAPVTGDRVGSPQTLSNPQDEGTLDSLLATPGGGVLAMWGDAPSGTLAGALSTAVAPAAGGPFGASVSISAPATVFTYGGTGPDDAGPSAAIDTAGHRLIAVWRNTSSTVGPAGIEYATEALNGA